MVIVGFLMGVWIFHAPLLTIFFVELGITAACVIGALMGWFILKRIYPHLRKNGTKVE
jgi:hypothetical protein